MVFKGVAAGACPGAAREANGYGGKLRCGSVRGFLVAGLLALVAASGCLAGAGDSLGTCDPVVDVSLFHPEAAEAKVPRAEGGSVPVAVWIENEAPVGLEVELAWTGAQARLLSADPSSRENATLTVPEDERAFAAFSLEPSGGADVQLEVRAQAEGIEADLRDPLCEDTRVQREALSVDERGGYDRGQAGHGVLVRTVGWWPNGSSFYTNMDRYHERPDLPHDYLGEYEGSEPLKVYVYNDSREEMPERYNESGYVTTIPGFNEALKGIPTVGGAIAYLEPSEAYTREGNEDHALYGDPLIFYIEALETRTVDCEVPQPVCTPPEPSGAGLHRAPAGP